MKDRPLHLAPCDRKAAEFAVLRWHYSAAMPAGRLMCYGVWEHGEFVGAIVYGRGASPGLGNAYGLRQSEVCELVRVALREHAAPVSRALAVSLRLLHKDAPGLRLVVSFADRGQGHHGGIYQATNWTYSGDSFAEKKYFIVHGRRVHGKTLHSLHGIGGQSLAWLRANVDPRAEYADVDLKHRYLYPLDDAMRAQIAPLAKPYPKRTPDPQRAGSIVADAPPDQGGEGGSVPTPALHSAPSATHARV